MDERPMTPQGPLGSPMPGEPVGSTPLQSGAQSKSDFGAGTSFEEGRETSGGARDRARHARENARQVAERARLQAREQASRANAKAREYGHEVFRGQRDRASSEIRNFSGSIRKAGDKLREENDPNIAHYLESAADQLERVQNYIRNCEPRQLYDDAQEIARRHPALLMGGLFATGFMVARFLKASTTHYSDEESYGYGAEDYWSEGSSTGDYSGESSFSSGEGQVPPFGQPT